MPLEWLHVLNMEGVDRAKLLYELNHTYTVKDVYDLLELKEVDDMYHAEQEKQRKK